MEYKDFLSIVLTVLTIGVVLSGAIGFLTIRNKAKKQATKIATRISEKIAKEIAEKVANEYIQQNLPEILENYRPFFTGNIPNFNAENLNEGAKDEVK